MTEARDLPPAARRVQESLAAAGLACTVRMTADSARTAADAAAAVGRSVAQIVKSLVFRSASDQPVLVLTSGVNRVDEAKVAAALGEALGKADADFVRRTTGFAIGGVPPLAHSGPVRIFMDASLRRFDEVWAAGGHPHAVFPISPADLERVTGAAVIEVC